jgi:outer membrane biosynthesis protein TonB
MALGAAAAVAVVVAGIQFGPWTHAAHPPASAAPPAEPVSAPKSTPAAQPESIPMQQSPPQAAAPAPKQAPANRRQEQAAQSGPTPTQAPSQQQQAPQQPASQAPPAPAQPAPAGNSAGAAELQQIREQLAMIATRAAGIRASLQTLQRSQAASGMNLRGDMQEAASLMNTYLEGSNAALQAGDAASARSFMDKAERQVEKLEKFLNR